MQRSYQSLTAKRIFEASKNFGTFQEIQKTFFLKRLKTSKYLGFQDKS